MIPCEIRVDRHHVARQSCRLLSWAGLGADLFRFDSGVEAIRLLDSRGELVVLPYLGQMVAAAAVEEARIRMLQGARRG